MAYAIRPAVEEDLSALLALYRAYHQELKGFGMNYDLREENLEKVFQVRIKSRLILTAVAEDESGALSGFVFCSILRLGQEYLCDGAASVGYLNDLYVAPDARRQALAARLSAYAEGWLRENGVTAMELQVLGQNRSGQAFWAKQGMQPIGMLCYKPLSQDE